MGKHVYSLVLSDAVIDAADRAAYAAGMSRSAWIDRVLSEHLRLQTPEGQARTLLEALSTSLGAQEAFLVARQNPNALLLRSALRYKYNPTLRYTVEATPRGCVLKMTLRTQNAALLALLDDFLQRYIRLEQQFLSPHLGTVPRFACAPGRMERLLYLPHDPALQARAADACLRRLDHLLKLYFAHAERPISDEMLQREYLRHLAADGVFC